MYLLSLLVLFILLGYLLATSRFGKRVDDATGRAAASSRRWTSRLGDRWRALFSRQAQAEAFRSWALGPGAKYFPQDFKTWLSSLSDAEARDFRHSLDEYANSLGFNLTQLIEGGLDHDPIMRQVFVEAIVVYSPAYRRARQAQQQAVKEGEAAKKNTPEAGDRAAEKSNGRGKLEPVAETAEPAPAA
jgi:hypothetical protein